MHCLFLNKSEIEVKAFWCNNSRVSYILLDKIDCKNLLVKSLFWKYCIGLFEVMCFVLEVYMLIFLGGPGLMSDLLLCSHPVYQFK